MPSQPLVSIIIVTYNSERYLESCLRSVMANAYWPFEVIIVDNNSSDATLKQVTKIAKEYPKVRVTVKKSPKNLGYAEGNNLGASLAQGKYLFILNPDTVVDAHFLIDLVAAAESNYQLAAVQPAVFLLKNTSQLNLTGKESSYLGFDWIKNYQASSLPNSEQIYSFSGSGVLLVADIFRQLGGYDPEYFMYYEDSDLSWRMQLAGYQIQYVSTSHLYHDYKYEPNESDQSLHQKLYYAERNRLMTVLKNYSVKSLLVLTPAFLILELALIIYAFISGWGKQKVAAYQAVFKLRRHIATQRQVVRELRQLTDHQILLTKKPTISFTKYDHPLLVYLLNPFFTLYYKVVLLLV